MKLTIHEVARVVDAKNDVTSYADNPLVKAEFDSRLIGAGDLFVPLKFEHCLNNAPGEIEVPVKMLVTCARTERPHGALL